MVVYLVFGLIVGIVLVWFIRIPIIIAKSRGITGSELSTICILSWVGIIFILTWIIAIVLALIWKPKEGVVKDGSMEAMTSKGNLEVLEKLSVLKDKGVITEDEFKKEKNKIMSNL